MLDYDLIEHHIHALKCSFELIGRAAGITPEELVAVRQEMVNRNGKHSIDWKNDTLGKLCADYYYCIEQDTRLREKHFLSPNIRMRLYRMATMNKDVKQMWDQLEELDASCFLQESEQVFKKVKKFRRHKG